MKGQVGCRGSDGEVKIGHNMSSLRRKGVADAHLGTMMTA